MMMRLRMMVLLALVLVLVLATGASAANYTREDVKEALDEYYSVFALPEEIKEEPIWRMARASPLALRVVTASTLALSTSKALTDAQRELVVLAICAAADSEYCVSLHRQLAEGEGVDEQDVREVALGGLPRPGPLRAAVFATRRIMQRMGRLSLRDRAALLAMGLDLPELNEIALHVGVYSAVAFMTHINLGDDIESAEMREAAAMARQSEANNGEVPA